MTAASPGNLEILDTALLDALLESDANYFRAAARRQSLFHACLYFMPALKSLAAGCVVLDIDIETASEDERWLQKQEMLLRELGCPHARFYQQKPCPALARQFLERGYRHTDEIALILDLAQMTSPAGNPEIYFRPVISEQDWALKVQLHQSIDNGPDGHASNAREWVQMERHKHQAGYMDAFFICTGDQVCGALNLSLSERLARLKNIVILPQWRQQQLGTRASAMFAELALQHGKSAAGCFAIDNSASLQMYKNAGFKTAGRQTEWFKLLS